MNKHSHFVTRLLSNAVVEALKDYQVDEELGTLGVVSDQVVFIGNDTAGVEVRMVVFRDLAGKDYRYITSRFDIPATSVVELYLNRWSIETFFAWIKRHLQLGHWYSENENGVLIQLYAALITFVLLKIYAAHNSKQEFRAVRIEFMRWIKRHLADIGSDEQWSSYCALLDNT
jgi:IS4 transposase